MVIIQKCCCTGAAIENSCAATATFRLYYKNVHSRPKVTTFSKVRVCKKKFGRRERSISVCWLTFSATSVILMRRAHRYTAVTKSPRAITLLGFVMSRCNCHRPEVFWMFWVTLYLVKTCVVVECCEQ